MSSIPGDLWFGVGIKPDDQRIVFEGKILGDSRTFLQENVQKESIVFLLNRLRGGGSITFNIKPRVQKETWSLYWKESMNTETVCMDPFTIEMDPSMSVSQYQVSKSIANRLSSEQCAVSIPFMPTAALSHTGGAKSLSTYTYGFQACMQLWVLGVLLCIRPYMK